MNWKTTAWGIFTILAAVGSAGKAIFDNDPLTMPDWTTLTLAFTTGLGLIFAQDGNPQVPK